MYIEKHKEAMQVFCQFQKTLVGSYGYLINPSCDQLQGDRVPVLTANDMFLHTTRPLYDVRVLAVHSKKKPFVSFRLRWSCLEFPARTAINFAQYTHWVRLDFDYHANCG
jgi:hypothetical protein